MIMYLSISLTFPCLAAVNNLLSEANMKQRPIIKVHMKVLPGFGSFNKVKMGLCAMLNCGYHAGVVCGLLSWVKLLKKEFSFFFSLERIIISIFIDVHQI